MWRPRSSDSGRPAFTLPETLAVLVLFALIAGMVAANFDALPDAFRHRSPEDMARHAFASARAKALETHAPVVLRAEDNVWRLYDANGASAGVFETTAKDDERRMVPIPDSGEKAEDAKPVSEVRFTPDGAATPVRVRLAGKTSGKVRVWRVEPFSAILTEAAE